MDRPDASACPAIACYHPRPGLLYEPFVSGQGLLFRGLCFVYFCPWIRGGEEVLRGSRPVRSLRSYLCFHQT